MPTFRLALENAAVAFSAYAFSMVAAVSWNNAIQSAISKDSFGAQILAAALITVFSLTAITLIMLYHDTEEDDGRIDTLASRRGPRRIGR